MNAEEEKSAIEVLRGAEGSGRPVIISGVWRVWFEHAGTAPQIQGARTSIKKMSNPDHVVEIHPVTKVGDIDTSRSLHNIEGFTPKDAARAFMQYETVVCKITSDGQATTLISPAAGFNYTEFTLEASGEPKEVVDGWFLPARVRDLEGELLVRSCRTVFVKNTPPADAIQGLRPGAKLRVLGMPRINLDEVAQRVSNASTDSRGSNQRLPYEIIIVALNKS
jgi:hypothetical protein